MITNNKIVASLCNDIENFKYHRIDGYNCYYKDKLFAEIREVITENTLEIYIKPIKSVEYITVNFTINESGIEFLE